MNRRACWHFSGLVSHGGFAGFPFLSFSVSAYNLGCPIYSSHVILFCINFSPRCRLQNLMLRLSDVKPVIGPMIYRCGDAQR
jgi:hypothetical protein